MNFTSSHNFILASASPRRKELFGMLHLPFQIETANVDERSVEFTNDERFGIHI